MQRLSGLFKIILAVFFLASCQNSSFIKVIKKPSDFFEKKAKVFSSSHVSAENNQYEENTKKNNSVLLTEILRQSKPDIQIDKGFAQALRAAINSDPRRSALKEELRASTLQLDITKALKDFKVSASLYGGFEDISDSTAGVALVLRANRIIFDGGKVDASVVADKLVSESAEYQLRAELNDRSLEFSKIWIELDKYQKLKDLVESRIKILDPLISQLEQVTRAGEGDVTQVSAAQRTVSTVLVTQAEVTENLEQAKLKFLNVFGKTPAKISYDGDFLSKLVPDSISAEMIEDAPGLAAQYRRYQSAEARLVAVKAKTNFDVGFESRATRPFANSERDSEEMVGLVVNKTLFSGDLLEAEIRQADSNAKNEMAKVQSIYRAGKRTVKIAQQTVASMDKAIALAQKNAQINSDEIVYLRKQLIIGGSTLASVLSSEARLYQAESREIEFLATRRKAELTIMSALGLLAPALGIELMP
jgi:outer membrane protein TolC